MCGNDRNCNCQKPNKPYCSDPCKKPCYNPNPCNNQELIQNDHCTTKKLYNPCNKPVDPCCNPERVYHRADGIFRPCCGNNIYDSMSVCCDTNPCCILQSYPTSTKAKYITKYCIDLCCNVGCNNPQHADLLNDPDCSTH